MSNVLGELDAAANDLRQKDRGLRGTVRIAMPGTIATGSFLERLRELLEAHPGLSVQTRITNTTVSVAAEGLDIALVVGQLPESTHVGPSMSTRSYPRAGSASRESLLAWRRFEPRSSSSRSC